MLPSCSHSRLTKKRGIFYFRRLLPALPRREVAVSLRTRRFREAEHRAVVVGAAFDAAWEKVKAMDGQGAQVAAIVREYLREALARDMGAKAMEDGAVPLVLWPLRMLREALDDTRDALADRDAKNHSHTVDALMRQHSLPEDARRRLGVGVLEAEVRRLEEAVKWASGKASLVLPADLADPTPDQPAAGPPPPPPPPAPPKPLASAVVEQAMRLREERGGVLRHTVRQERTTLRLFLEIAGDKTPAEYTRQHVTHFLDTLRRLPASYGKSPKDKALPVAETIARADADGARRLQDRTCKRHLSALMQFLRFCVDHGHMTNSHRDDIAGDHSFKSTKARDQRDQWHPEELKKLFTSPTWTGHSPTRRAERGIEITRDASFWLPLLALYHGARLEELADLRRKDIEQKEGVWALRISDDHRRLKNNNAARTIPMHPEVLRIGFVAYIRTVAPQPDDPLFPDLKPQGADKKRGPRFTRNFGHYRKTIGVYRAGVGAHAFRHTANTRLRDVIEGHQQERHVAHLFGHSHGGGEGRERYDKGPGLRAMAETLALLRFPEIDLSHLYQAPKEERAEE